MSPFSRTVVFVQHLQRRNYLLRKSNMASSDRPSMRTRFGWISRSIPAIIFTIPSGISRLPWVSSPWLEFHASLSTPRARNQHSRWRLATRKSARPHGCERCAPSSPVEPSGDDNSGSRPSCGGLRLDEQPRLDEQILTLAGDARASTVQASRVCGSNGFCLIGFWTVGVTDLPDGAVPLRADRPSACPNARPRAALRRRRPKCGADRGASRLVSTGGTTTSLHSQVVCLRRKSWKCGVIVSG